MSCITTPCIGLYDSGIGGITVLKALQQQLPHASFIYFADTAHCPYGNRSPKQIHDNTQRIINWFHEKTTVDLIVSACHTSSALALEHLKPASSLPLIGMINPMLPYLSNKQDQNIGIIATPASANSQIHARRLKQSGCRGTLTTMGCPDFVPAIESGLWQHRTLKQSAMTYLEPLQDIDTLIYGCSHYPWIQPMLSQLLPKHVHHLDPATYTAWAVKDFFTERDAQPFYPNTPPTLRFYCSHAPDALNHKLQKLCDFNVEACLA